MEIHVMSRYGMVHFSRQENPFDSFAISIYDPDQPQIIFDLSNRSGIHSVHYFKFWDETEMKHGAMSEDDATLLAKYVLMEHKNNPQAHLVVNCEGGVSRSAGVAAAVSKYFNGKDDYYFNSRFVPNMRCYRLVLDALHKYGGTYA